MLKFKTFKEVREKLMDDNNPLTPEEFKELKEFLLSINDTICHCCEEQKGDCKNCKFNQKLENGENLCTEIAITVAFLIIIHNCEY